MGLVSAAAERVQRLHARFRRSGASDAGSTINLHISKVEEQAS
jgi:hypothetical protein